MFIPIFIFFGSCGRNDDLLLWLLFPLLPLPLRGLPVDGKSHIAFMTETVVGPKQCYKLSVEVVTTLRIRINLQ